MLLRNAIGAGDTVLLLLGASTLNPQGGVINIDSEHIQYAMSSDTSLLGLVRGVNGTTAASHAAGAIVTQLESSPFTPTQPGDFTGVAVDNQAFMPPTSQINLAHAVLTAADVDPYIVLNVNTTGSANATLGRASSFGVLGDTAVTNTGNTTIAGDLGVSPGNTVTGFPPGTYTGTLHSGDTAAANAHTDATTAAATLDAVTPVIDISATDLGGYI